MSNETPPIELFMSNRGNKPGPVYSALTDGPIGEPFVLPDTGRGISGTIQYWRRVHDEYNVAVRTFNGRKWALKTVKQ